MPITPGVCDSFKRDLLALGPHQPGDDYRLALYTAAANLSPATRAYTPAGEVKGEGYKAGGKSLPAGPEGGSRLAWAGSVVWPVATIRGVKGALVYNASRGGRAVAVLEFAEEVSSTADQFKVALPDAPIVALA
jgi:hypothetical protein